MQILPIVGVVITTHQTARTWMVFIHVALVTVSFGWIAAE